MKKLLAILTIISFGSCNFSEKEKTYSDKGIENAPEKTIQEIRPLRLKHNEIPPALKFKGAVTEAWQWEDKSGKNILILATDDLSEAKAQEEDSDPVNGMELLAFQYIRSGNEPYRLLWKIADGVKNCPVDMTAKFIDSATNITDLDSNGIAETTIMYNLACRGDVSPSSLKLIMHEGDHKYALRGSSWVFQNAGDTFPFKEGDELNLEKLTVSKDEYRQYMQSMGRYESERDFSNVPPVFLQYAKRVWLKYADETKQWKEQ